MMTVMTTRKSVLVDHRLSSTDVCIAFSARDTEPGRFTFYNMLTNLRAHVIFVNDFSNGWYLEGTPEFEGEKAFLEWLRGQIAALKTDRGRLFTLGSSMGAYAALKYGALLSADRILALGPETELCIPLGRSVDSLANLPEGAGDISSISFKDPRQVLVISGNNDLVDLYCACKLKENNPLVNVNLIVNRTHVVAKYLNANFDLGSIIESYFLNGDSSFLEKCERAPVIDLAGALVIKRFNEQLAQRVVWEKEATPIRKIADQVLEWSMPQYFYALLAEKQGEASVAEAYLKRALAAQPSLGRARLKLAQLLVGRAAFIEAIGLIEEMKATSYNRNFITLLSKAYERAQRAYSGINALRRLDTRGMRAAERECIAAEISRLEGVVHNRRRAVATRPVIIREPSASHAGFRPGKGLTFEDAQISLADASSRFTSGPRCRLVHARIVIGQGGELVLGGECVIRGSIIVENNSRVVIGHGLACNRDISITAAEGRSVTIGNDCLFSDATIMTSDSHSLFDVNTGERMNHARNVLIGDRVWLAQGAVLLKGARVGSESVVSAGAVVTKSFDESNVVIGGNPAVVKRQGIAWSRDIRERVPPALLGGGSIAEFRARSDDHVGTITTGLPDLKKYLLADRSNYAVFYYTARSIYELYFRDLANQEVVRTLDGVEIRLDDLLEVFHHCNAVTDHANKYCIAYECAVLHALGRDYAAAELSEYLLGRWPEMCTHLARIVPTPVHVAIA